MKRTNTIAAFLLIISSFTACKKDNEESPDLAQPTIENLEIGLNNNEIGVIGTDFHFNADILVSGKIENVQVKIQPRSGETYAKPWSHEITWDTYKDAKNATVHKHFYIPTDAAEGKFDFIIIVNDQNGSKLELKKNLTIYAEANAPQIPISH
jgi:acid stress-induced BolA-like protein IbaG/YrbA